MNKCFFMCGLPGSGKSSWAEANKENLVIHSSDAIRAELGDINDQSQNEVVFNTLHKRIKEDLIKGNNVCYDSTGLKRKNRIHFLKQINDIQCEKICVLFATPYEICLKNNKNRDRKVPEFVIERMLKNFEMPCLQEGWDKIQIVWWDWKADGIKFDIYRDFKKWRKISHDNPHHEYSVGNHMFAAYKYMIDKTNNCLLQISALLHDCGKPFVKSFVNKDGSVSERARYFEHHNVGAYFSLFYLKDSFSEFSEDEMLYISLLINCHMRPFIVYRDSEKGREKDRKLFGDDFMKDLDLLHEADLAAH